MPRFKDYDWELREGSKPGMAASWDDVKIAILMDIRSELKTLNQVLRCPNFLAIPKTLTRIARNTAKPRRRRKQAS